MKKLIIFFILITFNVPLLADKVADKAPPIQQSYKSDLVAENVYVIHGPITLPSPKNQGFMNNPTFIITEPGNNLNIVQNFR